MGAGHSAGVSDPNARPEGRYQRTAGKPGPRIWTEVDCRSQRRDYEEAIGGADPVGER